MDISFEAKDVRIDPYNSSYIEVNTEIADCDVCDLAREILSRLGSTDRQGLLEEFEEDIRSLGYIKQE